VEPCRKRATQTEHRLVCTDDTEARWRSDTACRTVDTGCTYWPEDRDHSTVDSGVAAARRGREADTAGTEDRKHMLGRTGC